MVSRNQCTNWHTDVGAGNNCVFTHRSMRRETNVDCLQEESGKGKTGILLDSSLDSLELVSV